MKALSIFVLFFSVCAQADYNFGFGVRAEADGVFSTTDLRYLRNSDLEAMQELLSHRESKIVMFSCDTKSFNEIYGIDRTGNPEALYYIFNNVDPVKITRRIKLARDMLVATGIGCTSSVSTLTAKSEHFYDPSSSARANRAFNRLRDQVAHDNLIKRLQFSSRNSSEGPSIFLGRLVNNEYHLVKKTITTCGELLL